MSETSLRIERRCLLDTITANKKCREQRKGVIRKTHRGDSKSWSKGNHSSTNRSNGEGAQQVILLSHHISNEIKKAIEHHNIAILPPMDVKDCIRLMQYVNSSFIVTMLDPWYNKGVGGVREDYDEFIISILTESAKISQHVYLWGFPEIVARFVDKIPSPVQLTAWLTWYYKNNPSVIRGWRSSQMACLHLSKPNAKLYPEHFLNEAQLNKMKEGKLRYMPGPTSVIEASLNIGFVGKKEQTGHPSQKPVIVYEKLYRMATKPGDIVFDPMAGSGTTGAVSQSMGLKAILCDCSEEYTRIMERRLNTDRLSLHEEIRELLSTTHEIEVTTKQASNETSR